MALYRKMPVEVNADQWDPRDPTAKSRALMIPGARIEGDKLAIETLEGTMRADPGDWVIRGVKGEYYPCKPEVFSATYEAVQEDSETQAKDNLLRFHGEIANGTLDMNVAEMVCVPSKPRYGEVDLCLKSGDDGKTGMNLVVGNVVGDWLSFEEKKKIGKEIERRWNAGQKK